MQSSIDSDNFVSMEDFPPIDPNTVMTFDSFVAIQQTVWDADVRIQYQYLLMQKNNNTLAKI